MAVTHSSTADASFSVDGAAAWDANHVVGDGSFAAAKLSATTSNILFGRTSAGAGNGEEVYSSTFANAVDLTTYAVSSALTTYAVSSTLSSMAYQEASSVAITGGAISSLAYLSTSIVYVATNVTSATVSTGTVYAGARVLAGTNASSATVSTGVVYAGANVVSVQNVSTGTIHASSFILSGDRMLAGTNMSSATVSTGALYTGSLSTANVSSTFWGNISSASITSSIMSTSTLNARVIVGAVTISSAGTVYSNTYSAGSEVNIAGRLSSQTISTGPVYASTVAAVTNISSATISTQNIYAQNGNFSNPLPVAQGGTGSSTSSAARAALGAGQCVQFAWANYSPGDVSTYYWGNIFVADTNAVFDKIWLPEAGTIKKIFINQLVLGTTAADATSIFLRMNNSSDILLTTNWHHSSLVYSWQITSLSIAYPENSYCQLKWITPSFSSNPTNIYLGATLYME